MAGVYFIREQCYYALFFTFVIPGGSTAWHATELTELVPHVARAQYQLRRGHSLGWG